MKIQCNGNELLFEPVMLHFSEDIHVNVFSEKNNKTVEETLKHCRYEGFRKRVESSYSSYLSWELGSFLLALKYKGDKFYSKFLNKYGDMQYGTFYINDPRYVGKKGLYLYSIKQNIQYLGRCRDSFRKRINHGYGNIHPKNCYIDGQSTNSHLNYLITKNRNKVKLFICVMEDDDDIIRIENTLVTRYKPPWNADLKRK